jgi:hypothetical protein
MNRDELERKIAEASDGDLAPAALAELEKELANWPDLKQDFAAIMNLADLQQAYPVEDKVQFSSQINAIQRQIRELNHPKEEFSELSLHIFKKYALAASILIIAGSSALFLSDNAMVNTTEAAAAEEVFVYQTEGAASDNYMLQIENLLLDQNSDEY